VIAEGENLQAPKPPAMTAILESSDWLDRVQQLYDQSRYLDAWQLAQAHGPLPEWTGVRETIMAGLLSARLGSPRLAFVIHRRGHRCHPEDLALGLFYAYGQLQRRGPLCALELLSQLHADAKAPSSAELAHLHGIRAIVYAEFRDFAIAQAELNKACALAREDPWLDVVESSLLEAQDCYAEALASARRSITDNSVYRPGLQKIAHLLQVLDRRDEALAFLRDGSARTQCGSLVSQLARLETELEHHDEAMALYDRYLELSPLADKHTLGWANRNRTTLACRMGRLQLARELSAKLPGTYYEELAARLESNDPPRQRVCLSVKFVRQHDLTCAPATLSALSDYWRHPVEHLEVAEEICYHGTASHSERTWAERNGFVVREFTVTWEAARTLLDHGMPFTLTTSETTSGHLQAVVGYDELRQALLLRDPYVYNVIEALCPQTLERYRATGPRGMVLVPSDEHSRLEKIRLPDEELYDRLHEVHCALNQHRRTDAQSILQRMQEKDPSHRLPLTAAYVLANYDENSVAMLDAVSCLLEHFPDDGSLALRKYGCLTEHASRDKRLEFLRDICGRPGVDSVFFVRLGSELYEDSTELTRARDWIRRGLRCQPLDAEYLKAFADLLWAAQEHEQAAMHYRLAACVAERMESCARAYFGAVRLLRQTEEGLALLRGRAARFGHQSSQPQMTLHESLLELDRVEEAFAVLEEALQKRPQDGDLQLFAADAHARFGRLREAAAHLEAAADLAKRTSWLRTAASLATYRCERTEALQYWREVLETEPLAMDANSAVAWLLAETEGQTAAGEFVDSACRRFPHHCELLRLRVQVVRDEPADTLMGALRSLLDANPADEWAWRELTLTLLDQGQLNEALQAANQSVLLAPHNSLGYSTRGTVHLRAENAGAAHEDFRRALAISVDNAYAMDQLMDTAGAAEGQRTALAFVQEELRRQLTFGDGLQSFRNAARALLPPEDVLAQLQEARAARPDLWAAWSVVILQLSDMDRGQEALSLAKEACRKFPFLPRVWYDCAQVHQTLLQYPAAIAALEQALSISPNHPEAARLLADLQEQKGAFDAAQKTLEFTCVRSPLDAVSRGWLADFEWRRGHREAALRHVQQALRLAPGYPWGWGALRAWAEASGQPDLAVDLARDLVERRPAEPQSWALLAECLAERDDPAAVETVDKALALNPRNAELLDLKARLLADTNRFDAALETCGQLDPAPPPLRMRAAWVEAQRGRLKLAIGMMASVLQDYPAYFDGWHWLSFWHQQAGDFVKATEAADRMSGLSPHNPVPLVRSGDLRLQQGDKDGAFRQFERAFNLDSDQEYAGVVLFDLLVDQNDLTAAEGVLHRLRQHHDTDSVLGCRVKLAVRQRRRDDALEAFAALCQWPSEDAWVVLHAVAELRWTKTCSRMEKHIKAHVEDPDANPFLGAAWVEQRFQQAAYRVDRRLHSLFELEKSGRNTLAHYLDVLGEKHTEFTSAGDSWKYFGRCFKSVFRRHRDRLWTDDLLWGKTGYWLVTLRDYRRCAQWLADWPNRKKLESWMIYNHALALEVTGRWQEALPVIHHGLELRQDAGIYTRFAALAAFEQALAGDLAGAKNLIAGADTEQASDLDRAIFAYADAICLATGEDPMEPRERMRMLKQEIRSATGQFTLAELHDVARTLYRRMLLHLSAQPGLARISHQ